MRKEIPSTYRRWLTVPMNDEEILLWISSYNTWAKRWNEWDLGCCDPKADGSKYNGKTRPDWDDGMVYLDSRYPRKSLIFVPNDNSYATGVIRLTGWRMFNGSGGYSLIDPDTVLWAGWQPHKPLPKNRRRVLTSNQPGTFAHYIANRPASDDPKGDFVEDTWRRAGTVDLQQFTTWSELEGSLREQNASYGALEAARSVWDEYVNAA